VLKIIRSKETDETTLVAESKSNDNLNHVRRETSRTLTEKREYMKEKIRSLKQTIRKISEPCIEV
jgi:hypothetical protein